MEDRDFEKVVLPMKNKMFRLAKRLLTSHEDAEEIVQEALIKLWNKRASFEADPPPISFAMVVTRNLCLDMLRSKHKKYKKVNYDDLEYEIKSADYDIDKWTEHKDAYDAVRAIIDAFPEKWKTMVQLRDVEGMSYKEIKDITGYEETVIKATLSRARTRIKEIMLKKYDYKYNDNK